MTAVVKTEHPHIVHVSGIRGGKPIIKGTRIAVWLIAQLFEEGTSVDEILEDYPHLTPAQVYNALSYYFDHQEEIKAQIAENRETSWKSENIPNAP